MATDRRFEQIRSLTSTMVTGSLDGAHARPRERV